MAATCKGTYGSVIKSAARKRSKGPSAEFRIATDSPKSRAIPARCDYPARIIRFQPDMGIALAVCRRTEWRQGFSPAMRVK